MGQSFFAFLSVMTVALLNYVMCHDRFAKVDDAALNA